MDRSTTLVLLLLISLLPAHKTAAQQGDTPLRPLDVFDIEYVQDPQVSPDGSRVLYVREYADIMSDQFFTNLWVVDIDGGNHRPLTAGNFNDASARWSPDGSRVAFI